MGWESLQAGEEGRGMEPAVGVVRALPLETVWHRLVLRLFLWLFPRPIPARVCFFERFWAGRVERTVRFTLR